MSGKKRLRRFPEVLISILMLLLSCTASQAETVPAATPGTDVRDVPVLLTINGAKQTAEKSAPAKTFTPDLTPDHAGLFSKDAPSVTPAKPGKLNQIAQGLPITSADYGLSTLTLEMVRVWKLAPEIEALDDSFKAFQENKSSDNAIAYLLSKQRITERLAELGFDVRRCTNVIDREIAKDSSKTAYLTELRDKAIRYNTYADFVAGGLTGIISGALEMADLSRFASNTVDIFEGTGQSALSYWAYRAEHAGDRSQIPLPNMLAKIFDPTVEHSGYPESVWAFLSSTPPDGTGTNRAQIMLMRWQKLNFCFTHSGKHKQHQHSRIRKLTGHHHEKDTTMTIDILEDRTAMLQDLRAEITTMDESLAELFDLVRQY
ncbi:hypothetical protein KF728_07280 [Candidatus Obscuribacterales bacterium]|nr:hypothetical protein [Candidatus Obscuribacterales bacterium]MBX3149929.1 hypothetical protein [Candidatus Obscuribacterales bacterium]